MARREREWRICIWERGEVGHASSELWGLPTIMPRHNGTITEKPTTGSDSRDGACHSYFSLFQSPRASEQPREDVSITDDASSTGNKDEDDDEDEEDVNDENFDGLNRDPERLKAFNVSRYKLVLCVSCESANL